MDLLLDVRLWGGPPLLPFPLACFWKLFLTGLLPFLSPAVLVLWVVSSLSFLNLPWNVTQSGARVGRQADDTAGFPAQHPPQEVLAGLIFLCCYVNIGGHFVQVGEVCVGIFFGGIPSSSNSPNIPSSSPPSGGGSNKSSGSRSSDRRRGPTWGTEDTGVRVAVPEDVAVGAGQVAGSGIRLT